MKRADKAERIAAILDELYSDPPIPLDHTDPFTLLVAVVLSAQTTDKKVNEVTPALFAAAPTPAAMAALAEAEILAYIRQVGLSPQKAKALKGLAAKLVAEHGSQVPRTFEALEELPGVGHKTASVVMVQAFGVPAMPVDTHIHRLSWRWGLSDGSNVAKTEADLKRTFDVSRWNKLHLQIIYFGREHCPALRHDLEACPICSWAAPANVRAAEELGSATKGMSRGGRPAAPPRRTSR
ncbi:MAG: endonuclease III [Myxococcota bacterium]|nr:endonuclease III [Myxococcota bacterium]